MILRQLITLPLRSTRRGAELLFEGASRAVSLAWDLAGLSGRESAGAPAGQPDTPTAATHPPAATSQNGSGEKASVSAPDRAAPTPTPPTPPPAPAAAPELAIQAPTEPEPIHVDEQPELVAETADPGAEDGAGAQLTIDEPWPGYGKLNADDIIARLPAASDAELAVMELFEATHKRRRTVLSALQRQLSDK